MITEINLGTLINSRYMLPVLEYIHDRKIIHRDISLENVMLPHNQSEPIVSTEDAALLTELRQDPAWGWGQFSTQNVDIHLVRGDRITMMAQPHIQAVGEQPRICIEQANVD